MTIAKVSGAVGRTSYSTALITRVRAKAPATPATIPTAASIIPWRTMIPSNDPGVAPSATRTPSSWRRWVTAYASTP